MIKICIPILKKIKAIDTPNIRSSHSIPTPKGAGVAIIISLLILFYFFFPKENNIFLISMVIITLISFYNDYKQLSVLFRLSLQSIILIFILTLWPPIKDVLLLNTFIPIWLEKIIIFFAFLWFINLFNFMDGIDGISSIQCIIIGLGATLSLYLSQNTYDLELFLSAFITGASVAFLFFNWYPAKVFLGDAGSIPLGLLNALLLFLLCKNNLWFVALILNNYYLTDSTFTLLKRIKMNKKPWKAHKEHFYQIAVQNGAKHSTVCKIIFLHGILLILISAVATIQPTILYIITSIIISGASTCYLLYYLKNKLTNDLDIN